MKWAKRFFMAIGVIAVVATALIALVVSRINKVPKVPKGFRPPTSAPIAKAPDPANPSASSVPTVAPAPALPGSDIIFTSNRTGNYEIWVMAENGTGKKQLTNDTTTDAWWPRPSTDRRLVLFNRSPAGVHDRDASKVSLWMMNADGTNQVLLRPPGLDGWGQQGHAEWSPDGKQMVMFGGSRLNPQIYLTDSLGQNPKALTKRGGTNIDPSFSADGKLITFVGCPKSICNPENYEIYSIPTAGGDATRLTDDDLRDQDPYYSPDGTQLAWLTQVKGGGATDPIGVWDVRVSAADGSGIRLLTGDDNITSRPIWAPDGKTVLVHRLEKGTDTAFQLFRINVKTGALQRLTSGADANEYPG
jgi:Tol biopolymer transport system component